MTANISRDSFVESKNYDKVIQQQGMPYIDSDYNEMQDIQRVKLRRVISELFGDGVISTGGQVTAQSPATMTVNIAGGTVYAGGYRVILASGNTVAVNAAPATGSRTDIIYLHIYETTIDSSQDPSIKPTSLSIEPTERTKIAADITYVAGSTALPANTNTDYYFKLATITVNAGDTAVSSSAITDGRISAVVGVSGTFTKVTVNSQGRITGGTSLSSSDVTTALGFTPLSTTGTAANSSELGGIAAADFFRTDSGVSPQTVATSTTFSGTVTATKFSGDGSSLTNLPLPGAATTTVLGTVEVADAPASGVNPVAITTDNAGYKAVNGGTYVTAGSGISVTAGTNAETVAVDSTVARTNAANTFTGNQTAPVFISNVASGTAPFTVTSTTMVANLNAAQVAGYSPSTTAVAANIPVYNASAQLVGDITGNSATATKLGTGRTIGVSGAVSGSGTFDGSANLTITTTYSVASTTALGAVEISTAPASGNSPVAVTTTDASYTAVHGGTYVTAGTGLTSTAGTNSQTLALSAVPNSVLSGPLVSSITAGSGITVTNPTGVGAATISVDTSTVGETGTANTWSQVQTFSAGITGSGTTGGLSAGSGVLGVANTFTANQTFPAIALSGLTGATAASRFVGATTSGAPTTGTFNVGDFVLDQSGTFWICTTAGTPGTWTSRANLANSATKLATARTVTLSGDASGSFSFDGSANVSFSVTNAQAAKLTTARTIALSGDVSGSATFDGSANVTITATGGGNVAMINKANTFSGQTNQNADFVEYPSGTATSSTNYSSYMLYQVASWWDASLATPAATSRKRYLQATTAGEHNFGYFDESGTQHDRQMVLDASGNLTVSGGTLILGAATAISSPPKPIVLSLGGTGGQGLDAYGNIVPINPSAVGAGYTWHVIDKSGNYTLKVLTDGTGEVDTLNNKLDDGTGKQTIAGLATFSGGITGTGNTGTLTAGSGVLGTANTFTAIQSATGWEATGLTGSTAASRYVGATTSGAPTSGTFAVGDFVIDQTGSVWVCTAAGSPGTWGKVGATSANGTWTPASGTFNVPSGTVINVATIPNGCTKYQLYTTAGSNANMFTMGITRGGASAWVGNSSAYYPSDGYTTALSGTLTGYSSFGQSDLYDGSHYVLGYFQINGNTLQFVTSSSASASSGAATTITWVVE